MGIVWHGNYIKYFEEGREAFSKKYNFDYLEFFHKGYTTPIVHVTSDFKKPLRYRDVALVETIYMKTQAAKIIFDYIIRKEDTGEIMCKGSTTQVFVNVKKNELSLVLPDIFVDWARKNGFK
jgi:acyl-CoA thioester hydrolase